ncbi:cytochrome p450 [Trichoderma arundinaceum]|uniref:Cytochrome p450 n=1 Tax=Trichoderma arundinaceum TaxID=490622 RepID=A0A395NPW6_TRIAR|nr:cytochrome p450 [Trichoderma arundinaceum]
MANVSESQPIWEEYVEPILERYVNNVVQRVSTIPLGVAVAVVLGSGLLLKLLHWFLLPKPIPGIPYIEASARSILGDIPAMVEHIKATDGTFVTYLRSVMDRLNSPVVQVFMFPFGKPLVLLGDFAEAQDMLIRREQEFERSATLGDLLIGILPSHHVHLPTNQQWKAQRLLVRDLMTPSFLHNVAGPVLYNTASDLIELWRAKARIADGRPFDAHEDIYHFALDAMSGFTFGHGFDYSTVKPTSDAIHALDAAAQKALKSGAKERPISFPHGKLPDVMWAFIELTELVAYLLGNPFPHLTWAYVLRKPASRKAYKIKEKYIRGELKSAVKRVSESNGEKPTSAVDYIISREKSLSEKAGRKPDYFSRVIVDEVFGIVYTGHETTSTMLSWAVKFLADNPKAQSTLREALYSQFADARAAGRPPTVEEITSKQVPWLEATIEESLRCSATAPTIDRMALVDTQILGYRIPKGTVVSQPCSGPSITAPAFEIDEALRSPTSLVARRQGVVPPNWNREGISLWNPERWLVKHADGQLEFNPKAGPQVAFGLGTRGCYGKRLTYVESRILLTLLVWNFELLQCAPEISRYTAKMTTANAPRDCFIHLRELGNTS